MTRQASILISGRDRNVISYIHNCLREDPTNKLQVRLVSNGTVDPLAGLPETPEILILVLSTLWKEELSAIASRHSHRRPTLIVVAKEQDAQIMRMAMQAGSVDYLTEETIEASLGMTVDQAKENILAKDHVSNGKIIAMINAKGGSGASLLAANLGHILAVREKQGVALIDLDLQFAPLPAYFDLKPRGSLWDAISETTDEMDATALRGYMAHHSSNVDILASNGEHSAVSWGIRYEDLENIIDIAVSTYDYLLIDIPSRLEPVSQHILERADHILLVTEQTVVHLRNTKHLYNLLVNDGSIPSERINIIVNRYQKNSAVSLDDIKAALNVPKIDVVPNDYRNVSESINSGILLYEQNARAAITKSLVSIANSLHHDGAHRSPGLIQRAFARLAHR